MNQAKIRALIVEDVTIMQTVTGGILESLNCDVTIAENGQQALEKFIDNDYDIIFMDLGLPLVDGLTVAENIRSIEEKNNITIDQHTPIIALTAHSDLQYQSDRVGLDGFLTKPMSSAQAKLLLEEFCH